MIPIIKPWLGEEEANAAADAVRSGWVAQGPRVAAFEAAICAQTGAAHCVAVSSCTTALHLALIGAGVGPGDAVLVPSLSFIATTNAVAYVGATPVFADVAADEPNVTVATLQAALTPDCKAVIVAHQVGVPADIPAISAWCRERGLALIEDAACAMGSTIGGQPVGAHSDFVAFSFHPRKVLTTGEGGALTVRDGAIATRLRSLRQHAMTVSATARHAALTAQAGAGGKRPVVLPSFPEVGFNYRMTDIQAAVGLVQLGKLDAMVQRRRALADRYRQALGELDAANLLRLPVDPPGRSSNVQTFVIRLPGADLARRNDVIATLVAAGVGAGPGIMAAHLEPAWAHLPSATAAHLPETERWAHSGLALPLYHTMTEAEHSTVVAAVRDALTA